MNHPSKLMRRVTLYRITHIENVPHILENGITHKDSADANPNFRSIGDPKMISARGSFTLRNGRTLGAYIPFHFRPRMPMLYIIQNGLKGIPGVDAEDLVYCVSSVDEIRCTGLDFMFTNGHALHSLTRHFGENDIGRIRTLVDWDAVNSKYWNPARDSDIKRRKEAEFLVLGDIPLSALIRFAVFNESARGRLREMGAEDIPIHKRTTFYF